MKTFIVNRDRVVSWTFTCKQVACDVCRLRFFCFTTPNEVIISDIGLGDKLIDSRGNEYKVFFEEFEAWKGECSVENMGV